MTRRSSSPTACSTLRPASSAAARSPRRTLKVKDSVLTWDVSAIHEINEDVNVYARVAKGYRAPAIQGRILFDRDADRSPTAKHTMSYEAGIKTTLLDRKLRFNLTGYYFKTKDLQLSAVGGGTNANLLLNADAVKGHGFEAELEARPVHRPDADRRPQLQQHQDP